jgi:uncharacterized damage-inducible protein DinB
MQVFLSDLLSYHHYANERFLDIMSYSQEGLPEKATYLINHWINAQHIWNARILGMEPGHPVDATHAFAALRALDRDNERETRLIIQDYGVAHEVHYTNSKGESFISNVGDVLFHIFNHATYHRGQVALLMRQSGIEPPVTDYAVLRREGVL